jgi:hypothetical protein
MRPISLVRVGRPGQCLHLCGQGFHLSRVDQGHGEMLLLRVRLDLVFALERGRDLVGDPFAYL